MIKVKKHFTQNGKNRTIQNRVRFMKSHLSHSFLVLLLLFTIHCSSDPILLQPTLNGTEKTLGLVRGHACGFLGFLDPYYYFFPIGQNTKIERAYNEALRKIPGAKSIKNITIEEYWFWALLGVTQCITISGEAIQ